MVWNAAAPPVPTLTLSLLISHSEELRGRQPRGATDSAQIAQSSAVCATPPRFPTDQQSLVSNELPPCIIVMISVILSDYCVTLLLNGFDETSVHFVNIQSAAVYLLIAFFIFFLDVRYVSVYLFASPFHSCKVQNRSLISWWSLMLIWCYQHMLNGTLIGLMGIL